MIQVSDSDVGGEHRPTVLPWKLYPVTSVTEENPMTVIVHPPTDKFDDPTTLIPVGTLYSTGQHVTYGHQLHDDPATHYRRRGAHVPGGGGDHNDGVGVCPRAWAGGTIAYTVHQRQCERHAGTSVELASTGGKLSHHPWLVWAGSRCQGLQGPSPCMSRGPLCPSLSVQIRGKVEERQGAV